MLLHGTFKKVFMHIFGIYSVNDGHMERQEISLENLCAIVIARNSNCKILSNTPKHLYKIIMTAYLRDKLYIF